MHDHFGRGEVLNFALVQFVDGRRANQTSSATVVIRLELDLTLEVGAGAATGALT